MNKVFPIKTETACKLKWSWNTVNLLDRTTKTCCKTEGIKFESFDTFHNHPKNIESRKMMLNGKRSPECSYCWDVEDRGDSSFRQYHNKIPNGYPKSLDENISVTSIPTTLEVIFTNACNLKCVYCCDTYSSQIQVENKKFGKFEDSGVVIQNYNEQKQNSDMLIDQFWEWLDVNYQYLERLQILGGEPFFQKELSRLIEFMEQHDHPKLEFEIVSNLAVDTKRIKDQVARIKNLIARKKISRFEILASIDCWGKEQEYVRSNLVLEQWMKNFEYIAEERWIALGITQVVTSLTIWTMPDLLNYVDSVRKRFNKKISHQASNVIGSYSFLNINILGKDSTKIIKDQIIKKLNTSDWQTKEAKLLLDGIFSSIIQEKPDTAELNKMVIFLNEIDKRRNYDWKKTFSDLLMLMKEHNVV